MQAVGPSGSRWGERWEQVKSNNLLGPFGDSRIIIPLRIIMAGVMLYAAVPKAFIWEGMTWQTLPPPLGFEPFARIIYNYRVLPVEAVNISALVIPPLEALAALGLLFGFWLRPSSLLLVLLQTLFLAGMVQAMARGLDIHCGCFVGVDTKVGVFTTARDSVFLFGFVVVLLSTFRYRLNSDS